MSKNTSKARSFRTKRIAVIDADGILYAVACTGERQVKDGDKTIYFQTLTPEQAYARCRERIEELMKAVEAEDAILAFSDHANFRYRLLDSYKANRKDTHRPPLLTVLKAAFQEKKPYAVILVKGLEADDVCGICAGNLQKAGHVAVVCSPDKDLRQIPGLLWDGRSGDVEVITPQEADRWHLYQTLVGDSTDHYTGCPGMGPKKAKALLDLYEDDGMGALWEAILVEFKKKGLGEEYALTQARVARILRASDWDSTSREVRLWTPAQVNPETLALD